MDDPICQCGHPKSFHLNPDMRYKMVLPPKLLELLGKTVDPEEETLDNNIGPCCKIVGGWCCDCEKFQDN